jgi:hypothetical protein
VSQLTDYIDPSGAVQLLKEDQTWNGELALNPNFTKYALETPGLVPKGSTLRTHCSWNNTTDAPVTFPTEMRVFFCFILNENDIHCTDGKWSEWKSFGMTEVASAADSNTPAGVSTPMTGSVPTAGSMATSPAAATGCTSMSDQQIMDADTFDKKSALLKREWVRAEPR